MKNLIGQRFGRLTIIKFYKINKYGRSLYKCKCDCKKIKIVELNNLRNSNTRSCGCLQKEIAIKSNYTHGLSHTRINNIWNKIDSRCNNPKDINYFDYGGRGIKNEWKNFEEFIKDMKKSYDKHIKKFGEKNTKIERINNNGNYNKINCKWATNEEQANNKRNNIILTYNNKTQTLAQWAKELNINYKTIYGRLKSNNWSIEKTLILKPIIGRNQYSKI